MHKLYYPYIDGLRALAVISVIAYHLDAAWLPGGFTGVDVFFVISGFVVSASLAKSQAKSALRFALHFYARRFARILPALLVCLLLTSLMTTLLVPKAWLSEANEKTARAAFFGVSNVILALKQDSYYSPRAEFNPFIHTWSLGVEEQFYFIFPLLFYLWIRLGERRRILSSMALATLALSSLAYAYWMGTRDSNRAFYLIFSRFWELGAGVLLFQLTARAVHPLATWPANVRVALQFVGLGSIGAGFWLAKLSAFPYPWAFLPVAGTVLLILGLKGEAASNPIQAFFSSQVVVLVGRLSYSLYLWHWPVFTLMRWTTGIETGVERACGLALTALLATASFRLVEQPFRNIQGKLRWPDRAMVASSLAMLALGAGLNHGFQVMQPTLSLSATRDGATWQPKEYIAPAGQAPCVLRTSAETMAGGSRMHYMPEKCAAQGGRIFVMGDSHAGAYVPMLTRWVQETGREVFIYTKGGCGYLSLFEPDGEAPHHCREFVDASRADILASARPGDILFLPSLRVRRFGDQWRLFPDDAVRDSMNGAQAQAARARAVTEGKADMARFESKGLRIVLEAPKPIFKAPPFRCADWFNRGNPICAPGLTMDRENLLQFRAPALAGLEAMAAGSKAVSLWDPFPILCAKGATCSAFDGEVPLFFDSDHLTGPGNMRLYDNFSRCMVAVVADRGCGN